MMRAPAWMPLVMVVAVACGGGDAEPLGVATIDTMPGGIPSVMSDGPTAWRDTSGWRLVEDGALEGELGAAGELIDPQAMAVDGRGYVYVGDTDPAVIKVFDPSGTFVRTIGGEGDGPGEFRTAFVAVRDHLVLVHDPRLARASLYDTAGTFLRSWATACCYWNTPGLDVQYRASIPGMNTPEMNAHVVYLRFDTLGNPIDTLLVPDKPDGATWTLSQGTQVRMMTWVPFSEQGFTALDPRGGVLHGWTGEYEVIASRDGRDTTRIFGRSWTPEPLADARRDAKYEQRVAETARGMEIDEVTVRSSFDKSLIPSTLPAIAGVAVDLDGNTWVMRDADSLQTRFDVFDPSGVLLGEVRAPGEVSTWRTAWGRGVMYTRIDTKEGLPRIVRFRIERPS